MGFFRSSPVERVTRVEPRLAKPERRRLDPSWEGVALGGGTLTSGSAISTSLAETVGAVAACVNLICGAISSLPVAVIDPSGEPAPTLAVSRVLRQPNARQTWAGFAAQLAASVLMQGNAIAWVQTDGRGAVSDLQIVPWQWLNPQVVQGPAGSRIVYDIVAKTPAAALMGLPSRLLDNEVLHFKNRSDDGVVGRSALSRAPAGVFEAVEIQNLAASNWRNGMRPSGIVSSPQYIPDNQAENAKRILREYAGAINVGKVPLLEGGWTFQQLSLSSVDAEFLASRVFSVGEIARLFAVPEPLILTGNRAPTDTAPFIAQLAQLCLAPLVAEIEGAFTAILPAGFSMQIDLGGLLRGAFTSQAAAFSTLKQSGILTANDVRAELGFGSHQDGDTLASGPAPSFPADAAGLPSLAPKPGPGGDLPNVGTNENGGAG